MAEEKKSTDVTEEILREEDTAEAQEDKSQPEAEQKEAGPEEWEAALRQAVKQRDEYLALAQRTQADFDNFRRRNGTVRADAYQEGVRETLAALLPTVDNLERALKAAEAQSEVKGLREGVEMTLKQMLAAMAKLGLEEVPALGERFDPEMHNAVMRAEEGEPGTVLEVFEKGYRVKDRMIRYAMVKVAAE